MPVLLMHTMRSFSRNIDARLLPELDLASLANALHHVDLQWAYEYDRPTNVKLGHFLGLDSSEALGDVSHLDGFSAAMDRNG